MRTKRQELDKDTQRDHSQRIFSLIENQDFFTNAKTIAGYLHFDGEVDIQPLIEIIWQQGKTIALPIVPETNEEPLAFAEFQRDSPTYLDRFNIISPNLTRAKPIEITNFDLVLTPLVAFDRSGTRMGMGAGFYDRTFANHRPLMVGIAHQCQQVDDLVRQDWDIPLDYIVTEQQIISCHLNT